jgi:hypothetical protein
MKAAQFFTTYLAPASRTLFYTTFSLGIAGFLLGISISFMPGAEQGWFTITGLLLAAGLFLPHWSYRLLAIVLLFFCVHGAISGHRRGIEYRHYREQRGLPSARP